jgi:hypothetical protein
MESRFSEQIRVGYEVRSSDGEKLGTVVAVHRDSFVVEKGLFFTQDFMLSFDDVLELRRNAVHLSRTQKELGARPNLWDELAGMAASEDHSYVGRVAGQFDPEPEEQPYASPRSADEGPLHTPMRKTG